MTRSLLAACTLILVSAPVAVGQCFVNLHQAGNLHSDELGWAIDAHGGWVLVGASGVDHVVSNSGAVDVFDAATGLYSHRLLPSDPETHSLFGRAVAVHGGLAAVGAPGHDEGGFQAGLVALYDVASGDELATVFSPYPDPGAAFGTSVATWGGFVVVGAPYDDRHATGGGAVYVFEQITGNFLWELTLPVLTNDLFGYSLDIASGLVVVGAPGADGPSAGTGRVYLFDLATGVYLTELIPTGIDLEDEYGRNVTAEGSRAAISTSMDVVHVFDLPSGNQTNVLTFPSDYPGEAEAYLSLEGDHLLIGQPWEAGAAFETGRALKVDVVSGEVLTVIIDLEAEPYDDFGRAVHLHGGRAFIGSPGKDNVVSDQGALFVVDDCASIGTSYCGPAVPNSTGAPASLQAYGSAAVADEDLVLRMDDVPEDQWGMFLVSATQDFVVGPGGSAGNLCLGGMIGRFTNDVAQASTLGNLYVGVDLTALPLTPSHHVQPGETWNFQGWYRDKDPYPTSNFTDARAITFQ